MINKNEQKKVKEKKIFESFINTIGVQNYIENIENKDDPEPDILCKMNGKNTAYELTEIVDERIIEKTAEKIKLHEIIYNYYRDLGGNKYCFDNAFFDAFISFYLDQEYSIQKIRQVLPDIFNIIFNSFQNYSGDVILPPEIQKAGVLKINIFRADYKGVIFDTVGGAFFTDPNKKGISFLEKKFYKKYKTKYSIHLIGYFMYNPSILNTIWLSDIKNFIIKNIMFSPFKKVWVFDAVEKRILFTHERQVKND